MSENENKLPDSPEYGAKPLAYFFRGIRKFFNNVYLILLNIWEIMSRVFFIYFYLIFVLVVFLFYWYFISSDPFIFIDGIEIYHNQIPEEFLKLIHDIPFLVLGLVFGGIGGSIKYIVISAEKAGNQGESTLSLYAFIFVGSVMGMLAFFFIESKVIGAVFYSDTSLHGEEKVTGHGIALAATAAGYFCFELLGFARDKLKQITGK